MVAARGTSETRQYATPLVRKLGVRPGAVVGLIGAPPGFVLPTEDLPAGVVLRRTARGPLDVIVAFFDRRSTLERRLPALRSALRPAGGLWVAWPKRSSGVVSDLDENAVRACGLAAGLVDNKVCAIDETWSGLRLVIRVRDR